MAEHLDQDTLALLALGESPAPGSTRHLEDCRACAGELTSLRDVANRARAVEQADFDLPPAPERLWDRIERLTASPSHEPRELEDQDTAEPEDPDAPSQSNVFSLPGSRRNVRLAWLSAAAALVLVVAVAGGILTATDPEPQALIVAEAALEPLDDRAVPVDARVVDDGERLVLEVSDPGLPEADGYYAVWLIDEAVEGMVSLGPLEAGGRHALPAGLDLGEYPILDVSLEPFDGDPTHSGDSVLRAQLDV